MSSIGDFLKSKQKLFFTLSFVIIFLAIIISILYESSSFGSYRLHKILLSPTTLKKERFFKINEETGLRTEYSLSNLFYSLKKGEKYEVDLNQYQIFYQQIENLPSLIRVPKQKIDLFTTHKNKLEIYLLDNRLNEKELFQSLEIVEGEDVFRIQLTKPLFFSFSSKSWIYYQKAEIYNIAEKLFLPRKG